jgi:hypothetical protein
MMKLFRIHVLLRILRKMAILVDVLPHTVPKVGLHDGSKYLEHIF